MEEVVEARGEGAGALGRLHGVPARFAYSRISEDERKKLGSAIHWAVGIGSGALYAAPRRRLAGGGPGRELVTGALFGTAVWLLLDEIGNVALGLTPGPRAFPWQAHARSLAGREFCDVDLPGQFCFSDEDGNGTFDKARVVGGSRIPSVAARYSEYWKPVKPEEGREGDYRWELVYLGAGGGVLRFSAREYVDDPDRPATQNEVTYDIKASEPTSLTFRGVKLEVLEAGNYGIKLRVTG